MLGTGLESIEKRTHPECNYARSPFTVVTVVVVAVTTAVFVVFGVIGRGLFHPLRKPIVGRDDVTRGQDRSSRTQRSGKGAHVVPTASVVHTV